MENATKALLIAGTVLLAIIMVSIAVFLYSSYSKHANQYSDIISATELQKFNSKFEAYLGRENIKPQEIVTVVNLAKEYDYQIKIYLSGTGELKFDTDSNTSIPSQEDFIKTNQYKLFSCTGSTSNPTYDTNGKIAKLTFKYV